MDVAVAWLERLDQQIFFAVEVAIEASVGEMKIPHEISDRRSLASPAAEPARRGSNDSFAGLLLAPNGISHSR
jgi:hypothetical protein